MTDYQKKKLIDLVLILVGIIFVGMFLRTQLKDPIIIEVDSTKPQVERSYFTGGYVIDNQDSELPSNMDIQTVEVKMDTAYIDIKITFGQIPSELEGIISKLDLEILFDVNQDDDRLDDIIVKHVYKGNGAFDGYTGDSFESMLIKNEKDGEKVLSAVVVEQVDNTLLVQVPFTQKLGIDSETPVKVVFEGDYNQMYYEDIAP